MIIHTLDSGSELKSNKASQPVSQSAKFHCHVVVGLWVGLSVGGSSGNQVPCSSKLRPFL